MHIFRIIKWLVSRASRDTSTGQFIAEIDGLRFIAILSVFLFHLSGYIVDKTGRVLNADPLAAFLSHGHIGVQLFFILSGFVIALPYAKGHLFGSKIPKLKLFLTRRLSRLEPPYFVNLLILFILIPLVTPNNALDLVPHLLASLMYVHNIIFSEASKINVVAWSLEIELQFYLLAPLLTNLFRIQKVYFRRLIFVALIIIFSVIKATMAHDVSSLYKLSLLSQAQFFLTGFLLLDFYLLDFQAITVKQAIWDLVSVTAWFSIAALLYVGETVEALIVVPMFIAYCAAFKGGWSNRFFRHPLIYTIGGMCYTIYLYHYTVISAFGALLIKSGIITQMPIWLGVILSTLVLAPITLLVCTLLFVLIEKPCMKREWYISILDATRRGMRNSEG